MNFLNNPFVTIINITIKEPFMFDKLRYTSASFFAVIITLVIFVGMSLLVAPSSYNKTTELEFSDFSSVRDMKAPDVTQQPKKHVIPEKKEVKQPPATPNLTISPTINDQGARILQGINKTDITNIQNTVISSLNFKQGSLGISGGLTTILSVQPMYPMKQIMNKTEGWVKVQFTVNEYGNVVNASVLEALPARVFNSAALKAIKKSKFKPLKIDGKAVAQTATQVYEFKMDNKK